MINGTTIKEIKRILKEAGFSREEARTYVRNLRKEASMDEQEFVHPDVDTSDEC